MFRNGSRRIMSYGVQGGQAAVNRRVGGSNPSPGATSANPQIRDHSEKARDRAFSTAFLATASNELAARQYKNILPWTKMSRTRKAAGPATIRKIVGITNSIMGIVRSTGS